MSLKEKLLSLKLVVDNEYLDKYVELIESNKDTERKKFETHKHHIIPKFYYRNNNLVIDNSKNNIVNLTLKDHILAHYMLIKCGLDDNFILNNIHAFNMLIKKQGHNLDIEELESVLKDVKELELIRLKTLARISRDKNSGGKYIFKDDIVKHISCDEIDKYLSDGWQIGNPKASTKAIRGRIAINKDNTMKFIERDEISTYLTKGWLIGGLKKSLEQRSNLSIKLQGHRSNNGGKVVITNGEINKFIYLKDIDNYTSLGWKLGSKPRTQEFKEHISKLKKGVKNLKLSQVRKSANLIHINNGVISKMISVKDFEKYQSLGFKKGRIYARRKK